MLFVVKLLGKVLPYENISIILIPQWITVFINYPL